MPNTQWQKNRTEIENQIKNSFSELKKRLDNLKSEIKIESEENKKKEKQAEIDKMEKDLAEMRSLIDKLSSLQDQELQSLKTRLEQYSQVRENVNEETSDLLREKTQTPTTCELLKNSETYNRLLNIISSNPDKFKNLPWDTPEAKLEYVFAKIRNSIVLFMKNKLWKSENIEKVINNTIAPAFERNFMEMLRDQWNETNTGMLQGLNKISWDSFSKLVSWVWDFAKKTTWSYNKFSQWMNAIDYLSVHNWVFRDPNKSEVLSNPLKFQEYMNDARFAAQWFSPYTSIPDNIFKIDENQNYNFGVSLQEKQEILQKIWNIQVANNPKTTALIVKMLDKPEKFLWATAWLQKTANGLLDWVNAINSVTKVLWIDLLWECTKPPEERWFLYRIIDFVCKLIWITGGLEWIVKRWRLDRMNLTDEKNENIGQIFSKYQKWTWRWIDISITDVNSCATVLENFALTDLDKPSTTKWDQLRDIMADNFDINLISPAIIQQTLWNNYLKKEIVTVDGKQQEKISVDVEKIKNEHKEKEIAHKHIWNMKNHLGSNFDDLKDFYANIHNTDDIALCMTASLYVDKNDVIEWVKAKVFLPENYGTFHSNWTVEYWNNGWNENQVGLSDLTLEEKLEMEDLVNQSKTPNTINYLEKPIYKKYLNIIERDLNLPRYGLECVCKQESGWKLYSWNKLIWSSAWAQWLFQFMTGTADGYMKNATLQEKYWKTFSSRDEFLKDPLATARAAWIMLSNSMQKHNYNFQSSLACYNRWMGNYQKKIGDKNLTSWDLVKLPNETKKYVENITTDILSHNSASSSDVLSVDLWQYLRSNGSSENIEQNDGLLIWPKLLAHNKDEIGWLWNSIMNWFQWGNSKSYFPNMDGVIWKNTRNHPHRFTSQDDVSSYKTTHPDIKSFMFYFWANNNNNQQTISDLTQRSERLKASWIQPVLCTNIWADVSKTAHLQELNQKILTLWKEKNIPVLDFAKSYTQWDIVLSSDQLHPKSYSSMTDIVNWQLS